MGHLWSREQGMNIVTVSLPEFSNILIKSKRIESPPGLPFENLANKINSLADRKLEVNRRLYGIFDTPMPLLAGGAIPQCVSMANRITSARHLGVGSPDSNGSRTSLGEAS